MLSPLPGGSPFAAQAQDKSALRARLRAARRLRGPDTDADRRRDALLLALPVLVTARCVAAYVAVGPEPDPAGVVRSLQGRGVRVLLPVLRPDLDLDWAEAGHLAPSRVIPRLREPVGPRLGPDAIAAAEVVLVPALAVGADGTRLGQGGGSYDRALARAGTAVLVALLHPGELLDAVPRDDHDVAVDVAALPTQLVRCGSL